MKRVATLRGGPIHDAAAAIQNVAPAHWEGALSAASAKGIEIIGLGHHLGCGDRVSVDDPAGKCRFFEIVSVAGDIVRAEPFSSIVGCVPGGLVRSNIGASSASLAVSDTWLGRVIDPFGRPLDGGAAPAVGPRRRPTRAAPPVATERARLGRRISMGVRALDLFATCRHGQRIGLFAAAGVGKSTLLAMLARNADCDVIVFAMIGERGREIREILEDDLGPDGVARSVVVVATADASALMRREAAYAAMTIAEHFRDLGKNVLLLVDSITRYCHALREIALSAGEPPASRGYPPSVFAELPRLLERAGPGPAAAARVGQMSAVVTVLVDGDDLNEPIADSIRGLLDGHVVLDRKIAERGRFPAVNVGRSLSRTVPACNSPEENVLSSKARLMLDTYADASDLVRMGAYRSGSDAAVDQALLLAPQIEEILRQGRDERSDLASAFSQLNAAIGASA